MKISVDNKIQNGYSLDLSKIIELSFETYKKTFLISGIALIFLFIVALILYVGYFGLLFGFSNFTDTITQIESNASNVTTQIANTLVGAVFSALIGPIIAGSIYVNHLSKTNKEFGLASIFDFYKGDKVKDILINQFIITLFVNVIAAFLVQINFPIIGGLVQIIVMLFTFYSIPLIVFADQNYMDAITKSALLFLKQPFVIIVSIIIGILGSLIGIIVLCIGIFFTVPFYFSINYAVYNEAIGFEKTSPIDEIGIE